MVLFQPHGLQDVHMSLSTLLIYGRRSTAASLWSVRNPCVIQADSEPPGRHPPAPGSHSPSHQPVTGGSFASSGEVRLSTALADFRHISFVLTESQALTWALMHCLYWLTPLHLCGKLRYACNPCPIMAGSVPPGRLPLLHRVPISARGSLRGHSSWWAGFRLSASALLSKPVSFRLTAPGLDMSLSTFLSIATVAQRRTGYVRNPCVIQADAEPPGRRPPAPGSHPRRTRSVTGGPFEYPGRLTVARLTPVPESRFHPYGTQGYGMSLCDLLTIAYATSQRRWTRYVRNPCPFRWNRTPWPPTSCARFPRRSFRWLDLCEEQSPLPIFAFNLSVLSSRGPHCSSLVRACTLPRRVGESSLAASYGLHATPDYYGKSEPPDRLPSCIGTPWIIRRDQIRTNRFTRTPQAG